MVELYAEWAGPTQACKSAWRKLALEHGGAMPVDLSSACLERLGGAAALAPHTQHPSSEPSFLVFRGGREVACVRGLNIPALLAAVARAQGGAATVQRQSSTQ